METSAKNIGTILKDQRVKLGYSLQDAAQHTRIRKASLESIENNQFSDLPGQAYVIGFVKVYARYLGVDDSSLLELLEEVRLNGGPPSLKPVRVARHQSRKFNKPSAGAGWRTLVFGFLAVLVTGGTLYFFSPLLQEKPLALVTANQVAPEKPPAPGLVETPGHASEAQQDVAVPLSETGPVAAPAEMASLERQPLPSISPAGSSLRMLALSEGSLIIYLDDREPHSYQLYDGLDLAWKVKKMAKIEMTGPGMARFWLDAQELDLAGLASFQLQPVAGD